MVTLRFPDDRAVGALSWHPGDPSGGPTLARGPIEVPEGARVDLHVSSVGSVLENGGGRVSYTGTASPVDLGFLSGLPTDCIESLQLQSPVEPGSLRFLPRLAPGLRRLCLAWTGLGDGALVHISRLSGLTYLQTFGNRFTDAGVQVLAALEGLESLYLEEASLTAAALGFVPALPRLQRLGLQDLPIGPEELAELRAELPEVRVG